MTPISSTIRLHSLVALAIAALMPRSAIGAISLAVDIPRPTVTQGEPVSLRLALHNPGESSIELPILWYFTWLSTVKSEAAAVPLALQTWVANTWVTGEPAPWRGPASGTVPGHTPGTMLLRSGERCVVWWDVQWQYDLPPGKYRVRASGLVALGKQIDQDVSQRWTEFEVVAPAAKGAHVWANFLSGGRGPATALHLGPVYSLLRADERDVSGTPYAFWRKYGSLALRVGHSSAEAFLPDLWSGLTDIVDHPENFIAYPLLGRVLRASTCLQIAELDRSLPVDAWNERMGTRLDALRADEDWQWSALLAELLARLEASARRDRLDPEGPSPIADVRREWELPWHEVNRDRSVEG